jgi:hypothetical protein
MYLSQRAGLQTGCQHSFGICLFVLPALFPPINHREGTPPWADTAPSTRVVRAGSLGHFQRASQVGVFTAAACVIPANHARRPHADIAWGRPVSECRIMGLSLSRTASQPRGRMMGAKAWAR